MNMIDFILYLWLVSIIYFLDSCTFKLEKDQLKVSEIFPMINREKARLGILDWGVKMTTLEDGKLLNVDKT